MAVRRAFEWIRMFEGPVRYEISDLSQRGYRMVACDTSTPGVPVPAGNLNFAVYRYNCSTDQNPTDVRISI